MFDHETYIPDHWVPDHETNPSSWVRRAAIKVLDLTGIWDLLPGTAQGALCNCHLCRDWEPR